MVKRILICLMAFFIMISCTNNIGTGNESNNGGSESVEPPASSSTIRFISDVDAIESGLFRAYAGGMTAEAVSETVVGEPIIGVLLKYGKAPGMDMGDNICYLHYLGDGKVDYNGDMMAYNYILYVPTVVLRAYQSNGGQGGSGSGNAFWWYMAEYFGLSMSEIREDWYPVLTLLLGYDKLPLPVVASDDSEEGKLGSDDTPSDTLDGKEFKGVLLVYARTYGTLFKLEYLGDGFSDYNGDGMEYNFILTCPRVLVDDYAEIIGYDDFGTGNAFWNYMRTYLGMSMNQIESDWISVLDMLVDNPDLPLL